MLRIERIGLDYRHDNNFKVYRLEGYDCYLALYIKSKSELLCDGQTIIAEPGTFILFDKNVPQYYGAAGEEYVDDWIHIACDEEFIMDYSLPMNKPIHVGNSIWLEGYFKIICDAFFRCASSNTIDHLLRGMFEELSHVFCEMEVQSAYMKPLIELRREIYAYPEKQWSIALLAERAHLSVPYFQEVYKKMFNVSCMTDVISGRIAYAKNLLENTLLSIGEIAFKCGYNSVVHFSRQFRKETGMSPTEWRRR